ncbi:MAG: hypothetical protein ACJ76Z_11410 [Thermoleophilaceae bacterium]|jgi:Protein of unknown function (DUF4239)
MGSLHDLPFGWAVVVLFAGTFVVTAGIYLAVLRLARGDWAPALKGVSPGMLPPLGLVFGLIVGFLVAGLWGDLNEARTSVNREASALRSAELVAGASFPGPTQARLDGLIGRQIRDAANKEWPAMASQSASLRFAPTPLVEALQVALALKPKGAGQATAQGELVSSLEDALDARRQRIIVSRSTVNWVKWSAVVALGALTLLAIGCVHSDNRRTAAVAMGIFASAVAVTIVMIFSQDRPFSGQFGVKPDVLLQVRPDARQP